MQNKLKKFGAACLSLLCLSANPVCSRKITQKIVNNKGDTEVVAFDIPDKYFKIPQDIAKLKKVKLRDGIHKYRNLDDEVNYIKKLKSPKAKLITKIIFDIRAEDQSTKKDYIIDQLHNLYICKKHGGMRMTFGDEYNNFGYVACHDYKDEDEDAISGFDLEDLGINTEVLSTITKES